jgi:hypothetical protein
MPTGLILQRWNDLQSRIGCPIGPEVPVATGNGTRMPFLRGEMATSPDQGTNMVVAVYQAENSIIVNWSDTSPFNYDFFLVRWDRNGSNVDQFDVKTYIDRTGGFFHIPSPLPGHYTVVVEGCDDGAFGTTCRQHFTVPVSVDYVLPEIPNYSCSFDSNFQKPTGWIGQKWADVHGHDRVAKGKASTLGCPIDNEHPAVGRNGSIVNFDHGQIAFSPDQGIGMTVAAYQQGDQLVVDWGPSTPFSYDKWIVRVDRDGQNILQTDSGFRSGGLWSMSVADHMDALHKYTVIVEGCDTGGGGSTCRQGWTVPVSVNVLPRTPAPTDCQFKPSPPMLDHWVALGGSAGILGCPVSAEVTLAGNGKAVDFAHGEMIYSPRQGDKMVVTIYQRGEDIVIDWGDSAPFHYDKFLLRIDRDGLNIGQIDIDGGPPASGSFAIHSTRPETDKTTIMADSAGTYAVTVEGCDIGVFSGTTCRQGWTSPASFHYQPSADFLMARPFKPPVAPPTTVKEAKDGEFDRSWAASLFAACGQPILDVNKDPDGFVQQMISKLFHYTRFEIDTRVDFCPGARWDMVDEVNVVVREQEIGLNTGTSCNGPGDYDVALKGYITILYAFGTALDADVRYRILHLLNKRGPHDPGDDSVCVINVPETENHRLMIESSRYLTNQLLHASSGDPAFDNSRNGMDDFILRTLQSLINDEFIEYNSRPYERYSVVAIQNLFDYAANQNVRTAARIVLDYLAAKMAVSSNQLLRNPPYRRRVSHYHPDMLNPQADPLKDRFIFYLGPTPVMAEALPPLWIKSSAAPEMVLAAVSTYRPPDLILDLLINPAHRSFYQRLLHSTVEIYASEPDFLITASGLPAPWAYTKFGHGDDEDLGIVPPTFLMPTGQFTSTEQMIRVDIFGSRTFGGSVLGNLCVAPGFACGEYPAIPDSYLPPSHPECWSSQGDWTFVDYASDGCRGGPPVGQRPGFYVAMFGRGQRFGFFEAVPKASVAQVPLQQFAKKILDANSGRVFVEGADNVYTRFSGTDVRFNPIGNFRDNPIKATGDPAKDKFLPNSPFNYGVLYTIGDVLNTTAFGAMTVTNSSLAQVLTLDLRDIKHPVWKID